MAKTYHLLWGRIVHFENLYLAWRQASRCKRLKPYVSAFSLNLEENLFNLQEELISGSYQPGDYQHFTIHEPKKRLISAAPFRDRIVHHALCNLLIPIYEKKFIYDSYANRVGKGTHRAIDRCTQFARKFNYVLPLDVCQYFPSIDHTIMMEKIGNTITDPNVLSLCKKILAGGNGTHQFEPGLHIFPQDDLFSALRPRGLPIGNLTSQFWANVYLNDLDHFIKHELRCKGYIRYVDDLLLFTNDKKSLHVWKEVLVQQFAQLRLKIHENRAFPQPTSCGIPFLGFRVYPTHKRLKRRNVVRAFQRVRHLSSQYQEGEIDLERVRIGMQGWLTHASFGDTFAIRSAVCEKIVFSKPQISG